MKNITAIRHTATWLLFSIFHFPFSIAVAQSLPDTTKKPADRFKVFVLPTIEVAPEIGFGFGAVSQFAFRLNRDTSVRYSTAKAELTFTTNRQFIAETEWLLNLRGGRLLLSGHNQFLRFPELYWGIGPRTVTTEGERYQANRVELFNELVYRPGRRFYIGGHQRLQHLFNFEPQQGGLFDTLPTPGTQGGVTSGVGFSALFDTRDRLLNPSPRTYLALARLTRFAPWVGSRYTYSQLETDLRYYLPLTRKTWLALQTYTLWQDGQAPFRMLALMGSDVHMRGYYQGRYRGRSYSTAQMELRYPIWRWLRGVAFASIGSVSSTPFNIHVPRTAAGIGLRILIDKQDQTYLRFDYAAGPGTSGFYFSFGEAF